MSNQLNGAPASPRPDISFPAGRPKERGEWTPGLDAKVRAKINTPTGFQARPQNGIPRAFFPSGDRALSGIAIRAFLLGVVLVLGLASTAVGVYVESHLWRASFFIAILATFHFLEFWTTAAYNTPIAYISSFLLTNGDRYRQAHTFALIETVITSYFFPSWQSRVNPPPVIALGVVMVLVGQVVRSLAMIEAGTNFNHQVQSEKNEGHELVTTGLYSVFRHPSYFGFFWWALGTQVVLGNTVSLIGYACVLWYFFSTRIRHEEKHLVEFFGEEYKAYRARTSVWIPFVR
ncbi:ICMT-domain-containing protein [Amniculicola lignicola CBS 123094]|uniref:Protein-S-isoprenylcysteine O-methyltransferase n=1 Tax=Amniculicola lignicola CBS 123094 TaxID=1392246 RepID=A0A6A5W7N5_9PLEO|nr:ICMT-domain-containing protein [Amniculicola lignicola CBS 123094]